jgi:hypothetical protein
MEDLELTFCYDGTIRRDDDGTLITSTAFAGNDSRPDVNPDHIQGRNNATYMMLHNIGPLPVGKYEFGPWHTHADLGPHCSALTQIEGETYGRSAFYMHGASSHDPLNSSEGCVVVEHNPRVLIESLKPRYLNVVAS